ncbi:amidohydrolase family protein [Candidatus Rariloculus sp.]|uniref:amidohydrolase family protein n=1 Tax=Candidatus Rariloculus sp. TaxID=3101265 RepID=UPI003D0C1168
MRAARLLLCFLPWIAACSPGDGPGSAVLYEGARLIAGDGTEPIENSAFLVEDGRFTSVGAAGEVRAPFGAARVDLSGKTVMPGIVDSHVHLGYADVGAMTDTPENYSRENIVEHLERMAYYGVAAALSMGIDRGEAPASLRGETIPGAALFRMAGAGIAMPNAGPGAADRRDVPYGVTTEAEARAAVQELASAGVDIVKIWVDDRNGTVEKLTPPLYRAAIDEAHAQGLRVAAHIFYLEDAKELLRAGLDGFAHGVRDVPVDREILSLLAERPDVFLMPNLPASGYLTERDLPFRAQTLPESAVESMREQFSNRTGPVPSQSYRLQAGNLTRMQAAGVRIVLGTDGDGAGWDAHEEMADMVAAGLTPAEVIAAATSAAAEIVGLDDLGVVAEGKSADFIVLDANPLENINNTRRIESVYLRGAEVDRALLQGRWAE